MVNKKKVLGELKQAEAYMFRAKNCLTRMFEQGIITYPMIEALDCVRIRLDKQIEIWEEIMKKSDEAEK